MRSCILTIYYYYYLNHVKRLLLTYNNILFSSANFGGHNKILFGPHKKTLSMAALEDCQHFPRQI